MKGDSEQIFVVKLLASLVAHKRIKYFMQTPGAPSENPKIIFGSVSFARSAEIFRPEQGPFQYTGDT